MVDTSVSENLQGLETHRYENLPARLITFSSYNFRSILMTGTELSHAGFIFAETTAKKADKLVCVWCGLLLWDFVDHIDAIAIHQTFSNGICEFLHKRTPQGKENHTLPGLKISQLHIHLSKCGKITIHIPQR